MKFTTHSIMFIVFVVLITGILVGNKPVNLTGASITYPSLTGYCRQTVDPFTGVGSFMCDSATQVTSVSEGSLRKPGQLPLFLRSGGSTYMIFNPQRRCSSVACDLAYPPLVYTRMAYSQPPSYGMFSTERWCERDPGRCQVTTEQTYKKVYLQGSPYNYRRSYWRTGG